MSGRQVQLHVRKFAVNGFDTIAVFGSASMLQISGVVLAVERNARQERVVVGVECTQLDRHKTPFDGAKKH